MADGPVSRAERQEQTRAALVLAAREVFARDGFHNARLDVIAAAAGFSKGAIYSNFESKAALFLAVMDLNLEAVGGVVDGDLERAEACGDDAAPATGLGAAVPDVPELAADEQAELELQMSGMALATLEFIAAAARDDALRAALAERVRAMIDAYYAPLAARDGCAEDPVEPAALGALLAALDQGAALLTLSGTAVVDQRLLELGMQRLLGAPVTQRADGAAPAGTPALHTTDVQRRIADAIRG